MPKLINIDEDIPEHFYVFVNMSNPKTWHNITFTKTLFSGVFPSFSFDKEVLEKYLKGTLKYLPYEPCKRDNLSISPYTATAINDYRVEYDAEIYREKHHPLYPSRLSATFAFGSYETCQEVSQKYCWNINEICRFKLKDNPLNRVAKVNMEHISLARKAFKVAYFDNTNPFWSGYWTGFDNLVVELPTAGCERKQYDSGVIWEYLIEGVLELDE